MPFKFDDWETHMVPGVAVTDVGAATLVAVTDCDFEAEAVQPNAEMAVSVKVTELPAEGEELYDAVFGVEPLLFVNVPPTPPSDQTADTPEPEKEPPNDPVD